MPTNDPKQYEKSEEYMPYPSDTNDKPFMTYEDYSLALQENLLSNVLWTI
jgi:hypothetical protein